MAVVVVDVFVVVTLLRSFLAAGTVTVTESCSVCTTTCVAAVALRRVSLEALIYGCCTYVVVAGTAVMV